MRPLAIDLFAGLGGWTDGLLAEGWYVVGFDIEQHVYGDLRYPGQLVIQDVRTLHGGQFKTASLIVASPPCQKYSYMAMPWTRAKAMAAEIRADVTGQKLAELNELFDACFRIQREACEAAGRHIPMVVENVKGAQPWVGRARWSYGSYYLWGDVPALMPPVKPPRKPNPRLGEESAFEGGKGGWFRHPERGDELKNPGFRFDGSGRSFQSESVDRHIKGVGPTGGAHGMTRWTNPAEGFKQHGSGREGFAGEGSMGRLPSHSPRRKMASALIAKIPATLARHVARTFKP